MNEAKKEMNMDEHGCKMDVPWISMNENPRNVGVSPGQPTDGTCLNAKGPTAKFFSIDPRIATFNGFLHPINMDKHG